LILLACLLPLALYLLVLGAVNRRRQPLFVPGPWDFAGILFAASGFLLAGGPALLSSRSETWRLFWLYGRGGAAADGVPESYALPAALYFLAVLAWAAYLLWRRRELTAVYNADPEAVEKALAEVFDRSGLRPIRSGNLFLFGAAPEPEAPTGIQAPHHLPPGPPAGTRPDDDGPSLAAEFAGQTAVLEVDPFALMHHVSLRWDPADVPLRRAVERELARVLERFPPPGPALGDWLTAVGLGLVILTAVGSVALIVLRVLGLP
jgi:hypothetical protein